MFAWHSREGRRAIAAGALSILGLAPLAAAPAAWAGPNGQATAQAAPGASGSTHRTSPYSLAAARQHEQAASAPQKGVSPLTMTKAHRHPAGQPRPL